MDTIGSRILRARKAKGWSQPELAAQLGVNLKNISRWELNQAKPNIEAAAELAKVLEVSLDYLGGLDGEQSDPELQSLFKRASELPEKDVAVVKRVLQGLVELNR